VFVDPLSLTLEAVSAVSFVYGIMKGYGHFATRRHRAEHEHDEVAEHERERVRALYEEANGLKCLDCNKEFSGPLTEAGCPYCHHESFVVLGDSVPDGFNGNITKSLLSETGTHTLMQAWIATRDSRIRDAVINRIDCDGFVNIPVGTRLALESAVMDMWRASKDIKVRDCILNLYDNNTRKRIVTREERNRLEIAVTEIAKSNDYKAQAALHNQGIYL
jgi:hypothetical protein